MNLATKPTGSARANWLRSMERRLARHPRENAAQISAIGRLLLKVKSALPRGQFYSWLTYHYPYSQRDARYAMRAAVLFNGQTGTALRFAPSSLRHLLSRKVPQDIRRQVLSDSAKASKKISGGDVILQILDLQGRLPVFMESADDMSEEERGYLRLMALMQDCEMVHFSIDRETSPVLIAITVYRGGVARRFTREHLLDALAAATDQEPPKMCQKCQTIKPGSMFARGTSYCRFCERERVEESDGRRKAKLGGTSD